MIAVRPNPLPGASCSNDLPQNSARKSYVDMGAAGFFGGTVANAVQLKLKVQQDPEVAVGSAGAQAVMAEAVPAVPGVYAAAEAGPAEAAPADASAAVEAVPEVAEPSAVPVDVPCKEENMEAEKAVDDLTPYLNL